MNKAADFVTNSAMLASHKLVIAEREQTIETLRAEIERLREQLLTPPLEWPPEDAWDRVLADPRLDRARSKLSIHELRLIIAHAKGDMDAGLEVNLAAVGKLAEKRAAEIERLRAAFQKCQIALLFCDDYFDATPAIVQDALSAMDDQP